MLSRAPHWTLCTQSMPVSYGLQYWLRTLPGIDRRIENWIHSIIESAPENAIVALKSNPNMGQDTFYWAFVYLLSFRSLQNLLAGESVSQSPKKWILLDARWLPCPSSKNALSAKTTTVTTKPPTSSLQNQKQINYSYVIVCRLTRLSHIYILCLFKKAFKEECPNKRITARDIRHLRAITKPRAK